MFGRTKRERGEGESGRTLTSLGMFVRGRWGHCRLVNEVGTRSTRRVGQRRRLYLRFQRFIQPNTRKQIPPEESAVFVSVSTVGVHLTFVCQIGEHGDLDLAVLYGFGRASLYVQRLHQSREKTCGPVDLRRSWRIYPDPRHGSSGSPH